MGGENTGETEKPAKHLRCPFVFPQFVIPWELQQARQFCLVEAALR